MIIFPNCKINIGLSITGKRPDGYHNLVTLFYPIAWQDAIEVISSHAGTASGPPPAPARITCTGLPVPGNSSDNICLRAYHLLKKDFPQLPPVLLHLHKCIPTGAGLGGGSANGAFTLRLLDIKYKLNLTKKQLATYSLALGSDCPFFIYNQPCIASGRGDQLEPVALDLSGYSLVIVHPGIHIQTARAFSKIIPQRQNKPLRDIIQQPVETWRKELLNAFELPVLQEYPQIKEVKKVLYNSGAVYASLTGSGSAVYGLFPKNNVPALTWNKNYVWKIIP